MPTCAVLVRSHLDYCCSFGRHSPYRKRDIEAIEKVQQRTTKILPALKHLSYSERLRMSHMTTLHYTRIRGNTIEAYKLKVNDETVAPTLYKIRTIVHVTRGNDNIRLEKSRSMFDWRKYCFTNRMVHVIQMRSNHTSTY